MEPGNSSCDDMKDNLDQVEMEMDKSDAEESDSRISSNNNNNNNNNNDDDNGDNNRVELDRHDFTAKFDKTENKNMDHRNDYARDEQSGQQRHQKHQQQRQNRINDNYSDYDTVATDDDNNRNSKDSLYNKTTNSSNIVYVTNISPTATLEQMKTLFGFIGEIVDIASYHFDTSPETNFKVCFVEYSQHSSVLIAQHLTNTVFIDRALFVLPYNKLKIPPDKETVEELGYGETEYVSHFNPGFSTQTATGPGGAQVIASTDPKLNSLSLQIYPHLPINTDPTRIEEIRRTLYIGNLDSSLSPEEVIKFFNDLGEVKYIRIAGDDSQPTRFAFVEFTNQASIANALQHNGFVLGSRALKMNHSNNPIVKPPIRLDLSDSSKRARDHRSGSREFGPRESKYMSSSRHEKGRDRHRGYERHRYNDRRLSPRDSRSSRRSRSRDRSRRSRSREYSSRRSRSRDDLIRRRSRSRDSRKRKSRSRSIERRSSKHKSSSKRR